MKIRFLGTGTSDGIPIPACNCKVCKSLDPRDKRHRSGVVVEEGGRTFLLDISPDFRTQALRYKVNKIDALLVSHPHSDHIGGLDLIRRYNRIMGKRIPLYANEYTIEEIKYRYSYFFNPPQVGGGVSKIDLHVIGDTPFNLYGVDITPLPVKHGILDVLGFRLNDFVFITDMKSISEETKKKASNAKVLVLNALRYRKHPTHMSLQEAVDLAYELKAERAYFLHFDHDVKHSALDRELPSFMHPAYDGLKLMI